MTWQLRRCEGTLWMRCACLVWPVTYFLSRCRNVCRTSWTRKQRVFWKMAKSQMRIPWRSWWRQLSVTLWVFELSEKHFWWTCSELQCSKLSRKLLEMIMKVFCFFDQVIHSFYIIKILLKKGKNRKIDVQIRELDDVLIKLRVGTL